MPARRRTRSAVLGGMVVALMGCGALVTAGMAAGGSDRPDLTTLLPDDASRNTRWVDTQAKPGRVLYRFDTVILNDGGAFEVYRKADGSTYQRTWAGGQPPESSVPPYSQPPAPSGGDEDHLVAPGPDSPDSLRYSDAYGHWHFHSQRIAGYELLLQDGTKVADAAKNLAGFCLYDSWGPTTPGAPSHYGAGPDTCGYGKMSYTGALRMGIARGWGDFYGSQLWDQWVDVTDVTPGVYRLQATADPAGLYVESNEANNTTEDPSVLIPGVVADAKQVSTPFGAAVAVPLTATVVGAEVKSRKPTCADNQTYEPTCMTTATPGQATLAVAQPAAGQVALNGTTATYTPPAGFKGVVTFTYTGTDSRGLVSKPATVTVTVGNPTVGAGSGGGTGGGTGAGGGASGNQKPAKFTLSAKQLLINQRIGQAAIRRLAAVEATLDGAPAPTFSTSGGGKVTLSAKQLLINQRIYQAGVRRAATLEARMNGTPVPTFSTGKAGTVTLSLRQLIINQRIAQAAVRRANALQARV